MRISFRSPPALLLPGLIGMPARNPRDMEQALVRVASLVRSKIQARFFRLSQAQLSRRSTACHCEGQLQLKRCGRMQLAPQSQKGFRHPVAEPARAVQPDVATIAKNGNGGDSKGGSSREPSTPPACGRTRRADPIAPPALRTAPSAITPPV